jgi:signal transduction histidine kinase
VWPVASVVVALAVLPSVLWRRTRPLAMLLGVLVVVNVFSVTVRLATNTDTDAGLYTGAFVLILVYAVFRWASGRHCLIAGGAMVVVLALSLATNYTGIGDAIGGALVFFLPAEIGVFVRNRTRSVARQIEDVKLRERELLARELHDTVAHHVSAIAIRAQAGRAVGLSEPAAAIDALEVIEEEASRALSEMRTMVSALRAGEAAELRPQPGVADIERLATESTGALPIRVEMAGDVESLRPSIDAALYRIAQESITNAVRHARRASEVRVSVTGDPNSIRLTVTDDGDEAGPGLSRGVEPHKDATGGTGPRFGLVGMAERAKLLGGAFHAGPDPHGGWTVDVVFPRTGAVA